MHTQSSSTCKPRDRHVPTKKCISFTVIERNCAQRDLCLLFGSYFTDCCTIISRDKVPWSPLEGAARLSVSLTQRGCTLSCAVSRIYLCCYKYSPVSTASCQCMTDITPCLSEIWKMTEQNRPKCHKCRCAPGRQTSDSTETPRI